MPNLQNYPTFTQAVPTSCWACAARSIMNYNYGLPAQPIPSDQALANDWAAATQDPAHADIGVMQSASAALADLGFLNNIDSAPFPAIDEIIEQITIKRPLLAIIGSTNPRGQPNPSYQGGHWLVIVGADQVHNSISVFDPDPSVGGIIAVQYNAATYGGYSSGNYWQNTSYIGSAIREQHNHPHRSE